jgi:hypothetical protein
MACCLAMGHDCGSDGNEEDCCSHESPGSKYFVSFKLTTSPSPATATVPPWAVAPSPFAVPPRDPETGVVSRRVLDARSVPTYLRILSLRI